MAIGLIVMGAVNTTIYFAFGAETANKYFWLIFLLWVLLPILFGLIVFGVTPVVRGWWRRQ